MSTRSYIARQIAENQYQTIYCHSDGYLTYNGALLVDHYNTEEMVEKLIALGNLSSLCEKIYPDPSKPHGFDYKIRQRGVTVAYGRDRGEKNQEARVWTLEELKNPYNFAVYVYIYGKGNKWQYLKPCHPEEGIRDVDEALAKEYESYGIERPKGYYGYLDEEIADKFKSEREETIEQGQNMIL